MFDRTPLPRSGEQGLRRTVVGGLVFDRKEIWILIGNRLSHETDSAWNDAEVVGEFSLEICKGILGRDRLLMGRPDQETDRLLSDLLLGEDCGEA